MAPTKAMMAVHDKMVALGFNVEDEEIDVPFEYEDKMYVLKDFDGQKVYTEFKEPKPKKSGKGKKAVIVESELEEEAFASDDMDIVSEEPEPQPKSKSKPKKATSKKSKKVTSDEDSSSGPEEEPKSKSKPKKATSKKSKKVTSDEDSSSGTEEEEPKSKSKKATSKKTKSDKPKVKRAPTAYNLFIQEKMNELIKTHTEINGRERFSLAVKMWNAQPDVIAKKAEKEKAAGEKKATPKATKSPKSPKATKATKAIEAVIADAIEA